MATLAESFLADLEDLSDVSEEEQEQQEQQDVDMGVGDDVEALKYDDLDAVAQLTKSKRYITIMQAVRDALAAIDSEDAAAADADAGAGPGPSSAAAAAEAPGPGPSSGNGLAVSLDDPTYRLLVECNALAVEVENEVLVIHNFLRDKYRPRFPELESLVHNPLEFARVVKAIGNEMDVTTIDLDNVLPPAAIMVVTVTATTTSGKPLPPGDLAKVMDACERMQSLVDAKAAILRLVQARMHKIAPNLSEAVGSEVAAQLMGAAGGLVSLSQMPACNVQVLGAKRKTLAGFSTATVQPHQGFIFATTTIQNTPAALRSRAARLVGAKCALLARVDAYGQDPSGSSGRQMLEEMRKKIEKWQEPPPAKTIKPLPAPDAEPRKRRGGRRYRKMKERYGMTDVRKAANRMGFNQAEDEFMDGEDTVGLGVLGKEGSGRLRVTAQQQKQKLSAKTQKKLKSSGRFGITSAVGGLQSTFAFTPLQGMEFVNPEKNLTDDDLRAGTESYFSEYSGFRSLKAPPKQQQG